MAYFLALGLLLRRLLSPLVAVCLDFEALLDDLEFLGLLFAALDVREFGLTLMELVAMGVHSLELIFWPLAGGAVG